MMPDRPVLRIGSAGVTAAAMVQAGEPLTVAAVFERSFYCRDAADRWLCVLRDDLEPGPLHALAADWPARLGDRVLEGHTFAAAGRGVLATSTCVLDFRGYTPWHPPPFPPLRQELLRASLPRLRHAMREAAPPDTLAGVMVGRFHTDTQDDGWQQTVLAAVAHGVEKLTRWFASPGGDSLQDAVTALVGLGPGLTPTGDDILAGTALTLHAVGKTERLAGLAAAIEVGGGGEGTNRISLAHLRAAAGGQGAAPFHDVLNKLLLGEADFNPCLRRIDAVGHSSGWDILAGIVTALEYCTEPFNKES